MRFSGEKLAQRSRAWAQMSNATLNATGAAKLFATEKNPSVYGAFPLPLTAYPPRHEDLAKSTSSFATSASFAESTDFGLKLCPVANNVAWRVALNSAQNRASRI